jgi:hypothetical protein
MLAPVAAGNVCQTGITEMGKLKNEHPDEALKTLYSGYFFVVI